MMFPPRPFLRMVGLAVLRIATLAGWSQALPDSVVLTRAMSASTIAEIFVEEKVVRTEIEVGKNDLASFANVLPDASYLMMTGRSKPFEDRLRTFFETDWVVEADGKPLGGTLDRIEVARRVARDEMTGEPLAVQPADAEQVVRLTLRQSFGTPPRTVSIRPPQKDGVATANVGFVCYHSGLPVNDFRYLSGKATLDLDWEDPWYSRFRHRNLWRQYDAPLAVYLYVESAEIRKEVVIRPKDLQQWIELGLSGKKTISVESQDDLKRKIAEFLSGHGTVFVDGKPVEGKLDRIHFLRRSLRTTGVVDPPEELDIDAATLGVIFVYPIENLPKSASLNWDLFSPRIKEVTAAATDEAGTMPSRLTIADPELRWENHLTNPTGSAMIEVEVPEVRRLAVPLITVASFTILIGMMTAGYRARRRGEGVSRRVVSVGLLSFVAGIVALPYAHASLPNPVQQRYCLNPPQAKELLRALLYNVYRAFDHRDETLVYDRLERSISGELLTDVYLQVRRSMELENQGGARVRVDEVDVVELSQLNEPSNGSLTFRCVWTASGSVGHWGHIHRRTNRYDARIAIEPIDNVWKITAIDLSSEQRLDPTAAK